VADTGLPWELPYPLPTDLVRDGADAIKDLAEATADGLDAAGGLVAVKHALFTGTQTNSTATGANFAVTDLTITHTLADASNRLVLMAYFGAAGTSEQRGTVGIAVADTGTLIGIGAAAGSRTRVAAGGLVVAAGSGSIVTMPHVHLVHTPGDTLAHTYTVRAINISTATNTLYINRSESDADSAAFSRAVSGLMLMEVKV
jgi:hypothetical protein